MPRPNVEAERRAQILLATCEVVADKGRQALRVADVARVAGVSTGTVHYYFAGKKELLSAAFDFNFRRSLEQRRELLSGAATAWETLGRLVESYLPGPVTWTAWRVWAELWAESARDENLSAINEALYAQWRALIADLIAEAQAAGDAREGDPVRFANMLIGMIDGLATQALAGSTAMNAEGARETIGGFLAVLARG